jgi:hypothetical protein
MKKTFKILIISLSGLLLLVLLLPLLFQKRIGEMVKQEINKSLNAKVDYRRVSASFIRNFPNFTLTILDFNLSGKGTFENVGLFTSRKFAVTISLPSLLEGNPYEVERVSISGAWLNLLVLADGSANWDITLPDTLNQSTDTEAKESSFALKLKEISIVQSDVAYEDRQLIFSTRMSNVEGSLSGDMSLDQALLNLKLKTEKLTVDYDGMKLLDGVKGIFEGDINAGLASDVYTIQSSILKLNEIDLGFKGLFDIGGQNIRMDFAAEAMNANFKDLLSIVPAIYNSDFKNLKATGHFDFKMGMKGTYGDSVFPSYFVLLNVRDGGFNYPSLPSKVERFFLDLSLDNSTGADDDMKLDISRISMSINGQPIEGKLALRRPFSDPQFSASLHGTIDFEAVSGLFLAGTLPNMNGKLKADFSTSAKMSDINAQRYQNVDAKGNLELSGFVLPNLKPELNLSIRSASAELRPESSRIEVREMNLGESDFSFTGTIANYLPYLLGDGELQGSMALNAGLINVNELMNHFMSGDTTGNVPDTAAFRLELPERLNLNFSANVEKLLYQQYELTAVKAGLMYANKKLVFNPLNANLLGGSINMHGSFDGAVAQAPQIELNFGMNNFDIPLSYRTIGLFARSAPIANKTKGSFSTGFRLKGQLNEQLEPVFSTLQGGGSLQSSRITIESVNLLNMLADRLGNDELRRIETDGVNFSFEFINGRVFQKPFSFRYSGIDATLAGSIGFDQTLDYDLALTIPYQKLGPEANKQLQQVMAMASGRGISLGSDTKINIRARIGGLTTAPTITLDYRDFAANLRNELMQAAAAELEKQKEQLRTQAREEANKIIDEAKRQGDELIQKAELTASRIRSEAAAAATRLRREADVQAEKLMNEAKGKGMLAEKGAQEGARKIRQQADAAALRLEQEADKQANAAITEARRQADRLLEEARIKASQI